MLFMNNQHKIRYEEMKKRTKLNDTDLDRVAFFFLISGSVELTRKVNALYDFQNKEIYVDDWFKRADFSSGYAGLVTLAYNLFNGHEANIYHIFSGLDIANRNLAIRSIMVRFPRN